ncbi:hypothetical protein SMICM304S_10502 [Streptomyces microflavus]
MSHASPHLAEQVQAIITGRTPKVRRMRRAALATARYAIRHTHRSTPFGLFAGVAQLDFGQSGPSGSGLSTRSLPGPTPSVSTRC